MYCETFTQRSRIPATAEEAFAWHERPGALERLTPPWQKLQVLHRAGGIRDGGQVHLKLMIGPVPTGWQLEHRGYRWPAEFRDIQIRGPLAEWSHIHRFLGEHEGCWLEDEIRYRLHGGVLLHWLLGRLLHSQLAQVFGYRHRVTMHDLRDLSLKGAAPMKVLVSGSTGLVGSALVPRLTTAGHEVLRLVRNENPAQNEVRWDPETRSIDESRLGGIDAVVHLAGENIAARWTAAKKQHIRDSRVRGTQLLADALARLNPPPKVLVTASAIGIYGDRGNEVLDETSQPGEGFLADVCQDWEAATGSAAEAGIRVVNLRFAVILSPAGGALAKMLTPFQLGLGGRLGSGQQYMSWIAIDDAVEAIYYALTNDSLRGAVNVAAPHAVTNIEFTKTLGRVLRRPTVFPIPAFVARLAFGQMADEALLASQRVSPRRLEAAGFSFRYPQLEGALRHILGRSG